jgi:glutathione peroxidase
MLHFVVIFGKPNYLDFIPVSLQPIKWTIMQDFFSIQLNDIHGNFMDLQAFAGKKLMIVNVASECGFTRQYAQLEELFQSYKDSMVILGCPCNDFGGQEPGNESEILEFCQLNFGVSFPLSEKLNILGETHPLYQWLTTREQNGVGDYDVKWNFHKFLINPDGTLFASLQSGVEPFDDVILDWLKG